MISETSKIRDLVLPFISGCGVDVGYGGDSICKTAINIDQVNKYVNVKDDPQHLYGDCRNLFWFKDGVLDYVYSSHLLEDFSYVEQVEILNEWMRVLKIWGYLILVLPDQQLYEDYCKEHNEGTNPHHKNKDFSFVTFKSAVLEYLKTKNRIIETVTRGYSFVVVLRKEF